MKRGIHKIVFYTMAIGLLLISLTGCRENGSNLTEENKKDVISQTENTEGIQNELSDDFSVSVVNSSSWENNGMFCAQFDGTIKNTADEAAKDWKVTMDVPEGAVLENSWNGTCTLKGNMLEITPADYNNEIGAGQEITFGFIIDMEEAYAPGEVVLSIGGNEYTMDGNSGKTEQPGSNIEDENSGSGKEDSGEEQMVSKKDISGTPLENHGALAVKGTDIVDQKGEIYQLKGVSTHGINWFPDYVNKEAFASLTGFGVNAIRLAMYTADYNGYCSGGSQTDLEKLIHKGVTACSELGMYVIIDWHILNDNNPNQNKEAAKTFFEKMSEKYAGYDNVIYEICNEPNGGTTWSDIKNYSEQIIPVIRKNDKDAVIIVGTPNWSQDVDAASMDKIEGYDNIVYAAHFYASTHKNEIRDKIKTARENGLPVIISECSICEASGNGSINYDEAESWMDMIDEYHLSFFAWNLSNKDEQSSLLKPSVTKTKDFKEEDFSETGAWFIKQFSK